MLNVKSAVFQRKLENDFTVRQQNVTEINMKWPQRHTNKDLNNPKQTQHALKSMQNDDADAWDSQNDQQSMQYENKDA